MENDKKLYYGKQTQLWRENISLALRNEFDSGREGLGQIMFLAVLYFTRVLISSSNQNITDLSLPQTLQYITFLPMALKNTILTVLT